MKKKKAYLKLTHGMIASKLGKAGVTKVCMELVETESLLYTFETVHICSRGEHVEVYTRIKKKEASKAKPQQDAFDKLMMDGMNALDVAGGKKRKEGK